MAKVISQIIAFNISKLVKEKTKSGTIAIPADLIEEIESLIETRLEEPVVVEVIEEE